MWRESLARDAFPGACFSDDGTCRRRARVWLAILLCVGVILPQPARAVLINLEWRPASVVVTPGETVHLQLYAVSDDPINDAISVMDVIFVWNTAFLSLAGVVNDGPYPWMSSGLPANAPGGLNTSLADGDALYTARSRFPPNPPAFATPAGLHAATINFTAVAEVSSTSVSIVEQRNGADTIVVSAIPGLDLSGTLGSSEIVVADCVLFDFDEDGDVDLRDFQASQQCRGEGQAPGAAVHCYCTFDANRNGVLDPSDHSAFTAALTGPGA
jgi:hypothetical protein